MSIARWCVPLAFAVAACGPPGKSAEKPPEAPVAQASEAPAGKQAPSAEPDEPAESEEAQEEPAPPPPPVVTLVSAGAKPRRELRYHILDKQKERMQMVTLMDMKMSLGSRALPGAKLPPMAADMTTTVKHVGEDGTVDYEYSIDHFATKPDPSTPKPVSDAMDARLGHMVGVTGSASVTARGFTENAKVNVPPDVDPKTRQMLNNMNESIQSLANPLPEEPVGVGAKWDVTMHPVVNGVSATQVYHCKLLSAHGDHITLAVGIEQSASPQTLHLPNLPPGAKVDLVSLTSSGSGKLDVDLSHLVPRHSQVKIHSKSAMNATTSGQTQRMGTDMTMAIEVTPSKR